MVTQFSAVITGDREVIGSLQRVADAIGGDGLMPALKAAALVVQNDAKERAPVLTGTLKRSIHIEELPQDRAVAVGTDVEYAPYIEFGTSRMAAQPYLRPALDENHGAIQREFAEAVRDIIARAL